MAGAVALAAWGSALPAQPSDSGFERIRRRLGPGGRLGVATFDTLTRRTWGFDSGSRYAMCSTFKVPLAAAILAQVDRSERSLSDRVTFGPADVLEYAPVVRRNLSRRRMSISELCAAAIIHSDNSAANLLLRELGGPHAFNAFVRACGDTVTRLDRTEPELNTNLPNDERDTTTPAAMAALLHSLLFGDALSHDSQGRIRSWMGESIPGRERIPAGMPPTWFAAHKTGTGQNGASNDIAVLSHIEHPPIILASYISGGDAPAAVRHASHAAVSASVVDAVALAPRHPDSA